jgi:hypothetical protein
LQLLQGDGEHRAVALAGERAQQRNVIACRGGARQQQCPLVVEQQQPLLGRALAEVREQPRAQCAVQREAVEPRRARVRMQPRARGELDRRRLAVKEVTRLARWCP